MGDRKKRMAVAVNWIKVLNEWFCEKSEKTGAEG
jgi:hypothetical protein